MTTRPGPDLAFFVVAKAKGKQPACRSCHAIMEPGNMAMTINYRMSSGLEVNAYYHWRCVESIAEAAGVNADKKFFEIRESLLQGGELFPPSKG
jgi:hypothetical protein